MKPVDRLVRDYARPVLAEAGFHRKGNKFWRTAPNGDLACVDFENRGGVVAMRPDGVHAMPDWAAWSRCWCDASIARSSSPCAGTRRDRWTRRRATLLDSGFGGGGLISPRG